VLASLVDAKKKLEVVIDQVLPIAKIAEAFAYLEKGHAKGKLVVTMGCSQDVQKAKELLEQVNIDLKLAAEAANRNGGE